MMNIKNSIQYLFVISVSLLVVFLSINYSVVAYGDCPFGIENDPYPGICSRYIDNDNDGVCDHSQSDPRLNSNDPSQASSDFQINIVGGVPLKENENLVKLLVSLVVIIVVYLVLHFLMKSKRLSLGKERLIWNILLLIFFIPSAITGVFLILVVSFPFLRDFGIFFIDLHSVTSFFFMWISAYHIIVHTRYYIKGIKSVGKGNIK